MQFNSLFYIIPIRNVFLDRPKYGVKTISPKENCPPGMVRVWFRVTVRIKPPGQKPFQAKAN